MIVTIIKDKEVSVLEKRMKTTTIINPVLSRGRRKLFMVQAVQVPGTGTYNTGTVATVCTIELQSFT